MFFLLLLPALGASLAAAESLPWLQVRRNTRAMVPTTAGDPGTPGGGGRWLFPGG